MSKLKTLTISGSGSGNNGVYVRMEDYEKLKQQYDEVTDDLEVGLKWRNLALQFDGHRMQALWFLKQILKVLPEGQFTDAREFLSAGPLSGEEVIRNRVADAVQKLWDDSLNDVGHVLQEIGAYRDASEAGGIVHSEIQERVDDFIAQLRAGEPS